jgi:glycosyltransferase involved in cell wall biosynthesis
VRVLRHDLLDLSAGHPDDDATMRKLRDWFQEVCAAPDAPVRLVHGHNLHHFSSAPARALKSLRQELNLVLLHTYHSIWRRPEDEELARTCAVWDVHHAVSDFLVQACREVLRESVDRTYLGVDTSAYLSIPELDGSGRHPVILLPARLIPNKGATVAIRMLQRLRELAAQHSGEAEAPMPRLVLTDPFDTVDFHHERRGFRGELSDLVAACGLTVGQDVEFRPAGIYDMRKLYEEATVVVYPSRFDEPMGLAPLEAMCAARPVVATGVGGLGEGGSTLVAPEADEKKLASGFADEVWRLLASPSTARAAGRAAREHVRDRFDLERVYVEPMLSEYERLLRKK